MFHVLILRRPTGAQPAGGGEVGILVGEHAGFLDRWHTSGTFLVCGRMTSRDRDRELERADGDGDVILAVGNRPEIESIVAADPLVRAGMAEWEILSVEPSHLAEGLRLLGDGGRHEGDQPDDEWDTDELRRLPFTRVDVAGVIAGRSITPVLQHVGQGLLAGLARGDDRSTELAERCLAGLRERGWSGDGVLVCELEEALGRTVNADSWWPWPLRPIKVNLDELADLMHGDPRQGDGAIDLITGEIVPPGFRDTEEGFEDLDEDNEEFDPDRWLTYEPDSGASYRDMCDFTETVADKRLEDRLWRALEGRGAFRRFRDVLEDAPGSYLGRWHVFRVERNLSRARLFLAGKGYRAAATGSAG